jgi:hypothetical protein
MHHILVHLSMQQWAFALVSLEIFFGYKRSGFPSHFHRFERKSKWARRFRWHFFRFPAKLFLLKFSLLRTKNENERRTPVALDVPVIKKIFRHFRTKMKNTTISALSWPSNFNYRLTTLINKFFRWPLEWKCGIYHQFPGFALPAFILSSVFPVSGLSVCLVRFPVGFLIAMVSILLAFSF